MTSNLRSQSEPGAVHNGFLRSVLRTRDMDDDLDDLDEGIMMLSQPVKKITQEEQDALDQKARKRAMNNLVNSWQERLQLISVITTFFASTEAAMLVNTKPVNTADWGSAALKASNACFLGALIVHVYAAILSFLGAFLLIRYKLKEATREEMIAEGIKMVHSPLAGSISQDVERGPVDLGLRQTLTNYDTKSTTHKGADHNGTAGRGMKRNSSYPVEPPIISTHPHIEQVGPPFMSDVSSHLLSRTHGLCVSLAAVGFVLAITAIMCYAWASQPTEVSIFASACLGIVVFAMLVLLYR